MNDSTSTATPSTQATERIGPRQVDGISTCKDMEDFLSARVADANREKAVLDVLRLNDLVTCFNALRDGIPASGPTLSEMVSACEASTNLYEEGGRTASQALQDESNHSAQHNAASGYDPVSIHTLIFRHNSWLMRDSHQTNRARLSTGI
jgi:hypothetical protein